MKIDEWESARYGKFIKFYSGLESSAPCKLSIEWKHLKLTFYPDKFMPEYASFTQDDIKALLPYLHAFAEHGTLSPLQGGDDEYKTVPLQEENEKDKRIKQLEDLVERWRDMASETYGDNEDLLPDDFLYMCKKTNQLLGEEE